MDTTPQIRSSVEQNIRTAFRGVALGAGISLRRAQLIDGQSTPSREQAQSFTQKGIIGDWSQVPLAAVTGQMDRTVVHIGTIGSSRLCEWNTSQI